jgi:hypothetical protein
LAPSTRHTSHCAHVAVDLAHVDQIGVGNLGFGEQHVHVPGHAARDRVDRELDGHAALGELVVQLTDAVLGLRDGHAVAGDDDDREACSIMAAAFSGVSALYSFCSPATAFCCTWPNAPKSTLPKERFIALHMMMERMRPAGAVEGTGGDEELVVEHEAHRDGREARVGVQDRDDGGHVGAADGHDEHPAEVHGEEDDTREGVGRPVGGGIHDQHHAQRRWPRSAR